MGWETIAWCEWNPFCQKVLSHHFPKAKQHNDIKETDFTIYRGQCDILTGGFPCQPYSLAGKRKGKEDDRHLWPEMLRAIKEIQPGWVVGENVFGLINWSNGLVFHEVQTDLEAAGYEVWAYVLPACAVNAPHRRDRVWFVAYSNGYGYESGGYSKNRHTENEGKSIKNQRERIWYDGRGIGQQGITTDPYYQRLQGSEINGGIKSLWQNRNEQLAGFVPPNWEKFPTQSPLCSRNDGLSSRLAGITFPKHRNESIKAYGNAIVPQVAFQIFKSIESFNLTPFNKVK